MTMPSSTYLWAAPPPNCRWGPVVCAHAAQPNTRSGAPMEHDPEDELTQLGELRSQYRRARWVFDMSWIIAGGALVLTALTLQWWLLVPFIGFTLLAVAQRDHTDLSLARGRELDVAWVEAKIRVLEQRAGEAAQSKMSCPEGGSCADPEWCQQGGSCATTRSFS